MNGQKMVGRMLLCPSFSRLTESAPHPTCFFVSLVVFKNLNNVIEVGECWSLDIYPQAVSPMPLVRRASFYSAVYLYLTVGSYLLESPFYLLVLRLDTEFSGYTCRARYCGHNGQTGKSPHQHSSQYRPPISQDDHHHHHHQQSFSKYRISQHWSF